MALLMLLRRLLTVVYLMTHPAVPLRLKALPVLALLYVLFPRDAVFDFRPFGFLDDFVVAGLLVGVFTSKGWERVLNAKNKREDVIPADFHVLDPDAPPTADPPSSGPDAPPSADLRA